MSLTIRPFTREDIDFALVQTRREGWDNTAAMFELSLDHDPHGCFVAEIDGNPAGMVTSTRYASSAWLGNLIVEPAARRRGVGERLLSHAILALKRLGLRTFRLEADPMGIALYRRLGFVDQFEVPRFLKTPPHPADSPQKAVAITESLHSEVCAYDLRGFGDDRRALLHNLMTIAPSAFCVRHEEGTLAGYAATVSAAEGVRFGPCVADDTDTAASLLEAVLSAHRDVPVVTAVPGVNLAAIDTLTSRSFRITDSCLRMLLGPPDSESNPQKLIAIANGAIG